MEWVFSLVVFPLHAPDKFQPILGLHAIFIEKVEFIHQKPRQMEKFINLQAQNIKIQTLQIPKLFEVHQRRIHLKNLRIRFRGFLIDELFLLD